MKQCQSFADVDGYQFMLIIFDTTRVWHDGDERSKQAPGHGYPAGTDEYQTPKIYAASHANLFGPHVEQAIKDSKEYVIIEVKRLLSVERKLVIQ